MKILFVVAEQQEANYLIEHYNMKKIEYGKAGGNGLCYIDVWRDWSHENSLIVTGPGICNVIKTLSKAMYLGILDAYTNVVNIGYAGAKGIAIGEVVCVKTSHCLEFPVKADVGFENPIKLSNEGVDCYTSFDFVEKVDSIAPKALFDMELAYIARFVYKSLYSIKIVSDDLDYDMFKNTEAAEIEAWEKAIEIIEKRREEIDVSRYIAP